MFKHATVPMLVVLLSQASCALFVKPYPFCAYNGSPEEEVFQKHLGVVDDTLRTLVDENLAMHVVNVDQRRWLLVKAQRRSHHLIAQAWPPLACIAEKPYRGELGARKYRVCLLSVERNVNSPDGIVSAKDSPEFNTQDDAVDSDSLVPERRLWCNGWEKIQS